MPFDSCVYANGTFLIVRKSQSIIFFILTVPLLLSENACVLPDQSPKRLRCLRCVEVLMTRYVRGNGHR